MPLPYCNAPISADAEPATLGTASRAQAVDVAAMMPFIEKNTNTAPTITVIPPTPRPVVTASTIAAIILMAQCWWTAGTGQRMRWTFGHYEANAVPLTISTYVPEVTLYFTPEGNGMNALIAAINETVAYISTDIDPAPLRCLKESED